MLRTLIILLAIILQGFWLSGQVIRKNYREMTTMEKEVLVLALDEMGPHTESGTVLDDYATNHAQLTAVLSNT